MSQADWTFIRRLLIAVVVIGLVYFFWLASSIVLLIFAALLFAVLFSSLAAQLCRIPHISYGLALTLVIFGIGFFLAGFVLIFGTQLRGQITELAEKLPSAIDAVGDRLGISGASGQLQKTIGSVSGTTVLSRAAGIGYTILGILVDLLLVLVAAIYLAADPQVYRRGAAKLLPPKHYDRFINALDETGYALRFWFAGQLGAMTIVGVISALAYWLIGLPAPFALGAVAGFTNFVPYAGPVLGAIPALAFAFVKDMNTILWTIGAVAVIQQLEGNIITPLIQRQTARVPPAVVLFSIVLFGSVFGWLGVFLAVPMTVALMMLIKKLWLEDTLGRSPDNI